MHAEKYMSPSLEDLRNQLPKQLRVCDYTILLNIIIIVIIIIIVKW